MTAQLSRERIKQYANDPRMCNVNEEIRTMARMLLAGMDSEPVVTDAMALAFHQAITDSSAGSDDIDEIKTGLRAALANYAVPQAPVAVPDECPRSIIDDAEEFDSAEEMARTIWTACRAAMQAEPVAAAEWITEAKKLAEMYGTSFVVFRNGEEPQCADPRKVVISFTDEGLGYPAAPVTAATVPDGAREALSEAVAAIYFTDSSDYLLALFAVVKALSPETLELLLSNAKAAYDATRIAAAPAAPEQEV